MNVYMIYYTDEFEHLEGIEIVKDKSLSHFVNEMIVNDAITDDSVRIFYNEHGHHPETETEAVELLEMDGYTVKKTAVYE